MSNWFATVPLNTDDAPGQANQIQVQTIDSNGQVGTSPAITVFAIVDDDGPLVTWTTGGSNANIDGANNTVIVQGGIVTDTSGIKSLTVTNAGTLVYTQTAFPSGAFSFPLTLVTGANAIVATFTDASAAANTTVVSYTLTLAVASPDVSPPTVGWIAPSGNITIAGAVGMGYLVQANVTDPSGVASVTINGVSVTPDGAGNVSSTITLAAGANVVTIVAVDSSVNSNSTGSLTKTVTLVPSLGPTLTITQPASQVSTLTGPDGTLYEIIGNVTATLGLQSLIINGSSVPTTSTGDFTDLILLRTGENTITITATDIQTPQQQTAVVYTITLVDGQPAPIELDVSQDQIRMGVRIHERGLE